MYPDFLLIGAQKAGSSWLATRLRRHSEVLMTPIKEIHYFDRKLTRSMFMTDFFGPKRNSLFQRIKSMAGNLRREPIHGLMWPVRYFFQKHSDQWYSSLFVEGESRLQGDCTPAYSTLNRETVRHIAELMPSAKVMFIMRNPVDRSWSHAKMDLGNWAKRPLDTIPDEEYIAHAQTPESLLRSDYLRTLDVWGEAFPPERFKCMFFEDLKDTPDSFLADVCVFLGIGPSRKESRKELGQAVNVGMKYDMPTAVRRHLCLQYHDMIRELSKRFGGHATTWLEGVELFLSSSEGNG